MTVSRNAASVAPSFSEYTLAGAKETLKILETAAEFIPIPFRGVIRVGVAVLQVCEDMTEIGERVREMQDRVGKLMLVIVYRVTASLEGELNETTFPNDFRKDIDNLKGTLEFLYQSLTTVKSQNRWLLVLFKEINKSKLEDCRNRLAGALERFSVSSHMRNALIMQDIQGWLAKNNALSQSIYEKVDSLVTNMNNTHNAPKRPTRQHIPSKPKVFCGRDALVQEIAELLCKDETSRVCILGPCGMGKTSLALAVVESPLVQSNYSESCRFWVPCVEAVSPPIFLQLLHVQLGISRATNDTLEDILAELRVSSEPRLILLDNFETPWTSVEHTRHQVNNILGRLGQIPHVALLVTMRGTEPPCDDVVWQSKNLHPVDMEAARSIFQEIDPKSKQDPGVDSLVAVLGYLPFAVILMAKLGKKSRSSTEDLLRDWSRVGTKMISSSSPDENMNHSIMLSVHKDFVQRDPDACLLLTTLSLLPAGTSRANLRCWIPNLQSISSAIATLADAALLMMNDGGTPETSTLYVLPVVQSYMSTTDQIPNHVRRHVQEACCQYLFDHGYRYHEPAFERHSEALAGEGTNIRVILLTLTPLGYSSITERQIEALLRFAWFHLDTSRPSLEIAHHAVVVTKSLGKDRYIAEALLILGDTYHQISKYELAEKFLMEAYELFNTLTKTNHVATLITQCGICLADTRMALRPSESIVDFIRDLQSRFNVSLDEFNQACVLRALGFSLYCDDECIEGMNLLHEAKDAFTKMGQRVDAAHSMLCIARSYQWTSATRNASKPQRTSNIESALKSIEEACEIMKPVKNQGLHAEIDLCHGQILMTLGRHCEALIKFEKSLSTFGYLEAISQVAVTLECFGYIHMCKRDYKKAWDAYKAALEQYLKMGQSSLTETMIRRCNTNLVKIEIKEANPDEDISLLEPPM